MGRFARLGNQLYSGERSINFVGRWRVWYAISAIFLVIALVGVVGKGLNLGIDFTGGTAFRVQTSSSVGQDEADAIRTAVVETGLDAAASPIVSTAGDSGVLVQTEPMTADESAQVAQAILDVTGTDQDSLSQSDIGASWGKQVAQRSLIGLLVFLVLTVLFIWAYFREWKMSAAALLALAHDVLITVGIYALVGFEVTPATVTGILTILAFSLYDTVVVFDKVKENAARMRERRQTYAFAANLAVNQTLVRSINTSIVALLPIGSILWVGAIQLGASSLQDLALALFVGTAVGAYSSIFIATPFLVQLKSRETEVVQAEKRAKARERAAADRYAAVPAFTEDMPVREESELGDDDDVDDEDSAGTGGTHATSPERRPEAMGKGRVAPPSRGPIRQSGSAGRQQPSRQSKSQRGKK